MNRKIDIKKLTVLSMLCAIAYLSVFVFSPIKVQFLSFEIKDAILAIGGFLYGPVAAVSSVVLVAFLEFVTFSQTGLWGLLMNVLSSAFFLFPAAYVYKKNRSLKGAVTGLSIGVLLTVTAMVLWNWLVTPFYMGVPRAVVEGMLIPLFLPFNALKASANAALSLLLYKTVVAALRRARLVPQSEYAEEKRDRIFIVPLLLLVMLTLILLVWSGII